jgi:hypothetical protein
MTMSFRSASRSLRIALLLAGCVLAPTALANALESEPTLATATLLPAGTPLSGAGWSLPEQTQVASYLGQFRFTTDWGVIEAQGREIALERIAEMPALARIDEVSRGQVFADAIRQSATRTGESIARVVTQPVETVKGIPAGLGRLITKTAGTVRRVAQRVGDATAEGSGSAGEASGGATHGERLTDFAKESFGLNKARRALAQPLGIDPYTRNPLLGERLEGLAWAAVAGGASMDLALAALSGGVSNVVSVAGKLDSLVWDLPPADIRDRLEKRLVAQGANGRAAREWLRTPAFSPTLQVRMVTAIAALGSPRGLDEVLALAASVQSEAHARFLIQQLEMLASAGRGDPIVELRALEQSISARTRAAVPVIALPVDHLSWTDPVERADRRRSGRILVAGSLSPRARQELSTRGWRIEADKGWPRER